MKLLYSLLFVSFYLLISCDSIEDFMKKNRNTEEGIPPLVKNLNINELKEKGSARKCSKYSNSGSFSILGDASLLEPVRNCFAQSIDQGLKPLCDQEKALKQALKTESEPVIQEEIEGELAEVEEAKYHIAEDLYYIAHEFELISEEAVEDFEKERSDHDPWGNLINTLGSIFVKSEIGGFSRFLNSKVNNACRGVNVRRS